MSAGGGGHGGGAKGKEKAPPSIDFNVQNYLDNLIGYESGYQSLVNDLVRDGKHKAGIPQNNLDTIVNGWLNKKKEHVVKNWFKAEGANAETIAKLGDTALEFLPTKQELIEDLKPYIGKDGKIKFTERTIRQYVDAATGRMTQKVLQQLTLKLGKNDPAALDNFAKTLYKDMGVADEYKVFKSLHDEQKKVQKLVGDINQYKLPQLRRKQDLGEYGAPAQDYGHGKPAAKGGH